LTEETEEVTNKRRPAKERGCWGKGLRHGEEGGPSKNQEEVISQRRRRQGPKVEMTGRDAKGTREAGRNLSRSKSLYKEEGLKKKNIGKTVRSGSVMEGGRPSKGTYKEIESQGDQ